VALRLGAPHLGSEHLVLGAAQIPESVAGRALRRLGLDAVAVEAAVRSLPSDDLDDEALASVGIDLGAVRQRAEATFGAGAFDTAAPSARPRRIGAHVPLDAAARKVLETSLREAIRLKRNHIDTGHLLLAAARLDETPAHRVLLALGTTPDALRQAVIATWADPGRE
jgi:ATP-dependent Clp protease ATP-binding subunit ClpA